MRLVGLVGMALMMSVLVIGLTLCRWRMRDHA